jgi:hypothetical protein
VTIFSDAVACHQEFIENIARGTLLTDPEFCKLLKKIMKCCMVLRSFKLSQPSPMQLPGRGGKSKAGGKMDEEKKPVSTNQLGESLQKCQHVSDLFDDNMKKLLIYMERE